MQVCEIFTSIEGEGIRAGKVCTFVRFVGCNLRCAWCDTTYSYDGGKEMSPAEILESIPEDCMLVTLTGGEPLLQDAEKAHNEDFMHDIIGVGVCNDGIGFCRCPS